MNCSSCGLEKELTRHGTCFKCHVGGLQVSKRCKDCSKNLADFRISQNLTATSTLTPVEK